MYFYTICDTLRKDKLLIVTAKNCRVEFSLKTDSITLARGDFRVTFASNICLENVIPSDVLFDNVKTCYKEIKEKLIFKNGL